MKAISFVLLIPTIAACSGAPRAKDWYERQATPAGGYHEKKFVDAHDRSIQELIVRLDSLETSIDSDGSEREAKRIIRMLARHAERGSLARVAEHIVWKLSSRPARAGRHEIYLLDFLGRCQELIFEYGGDDAPTVENLGSYSINANRRATFLRILIDKAAIALRTFVQDGSYYAGLVCDILERAEWGAVARIPRDPDPDSTGFRRSTEDALRRYRARLAL